LCVGLIRGVKIKGFSPDYGYSTRTHAEEGRAERSGQAERSGEWRFEGLPRL
jgi:hypothetical protein